MGWVRCVEYAVKGVTSVLVLIALGMAAFNITNYTPEINKNYLLVVLYCVLVPALMTNALCTWFDIGLFCDSPIVTESSFEIFLENEYMQLVLMQLILNTSDELFTVVRLACTGNHKETERKIEAEKTK